MTSSLGIGSSVDEEILKAILQKKNDVEAEIVSDPEVMRRFIDHGTMAIKRTATASAGASDHATCTAFCLYYLTASDLLGASRATPPFKALKRDEATAAVSALEKLIIDGHRKSATTAKTDTGSLPNQYNSSIQLAGYLKTQLALSSAPSNDAMASVLAIVTFLVDLIAETGGFAPRLGSAQNAPSAYLTYWTGAALSEYVRLGSLELRDRAISALDRIALWSERELANEIAFHHAGLRSRFDVIELAYAALSAARFGSGTDGRQLARDGMGILFAHYFADGCFAPSAPVLADRANNFSLQCSTAEALALHLMLLPELFIDSWEPLCKTFDWLRLQRRKGEGWCPENVGRYEEPTAFMTASAIAFLNSLTELLDKTLHSGAAEVLAVPAFSPDPKLNSYRYPEDVGRLLHSNVIKPLAAGSDNYELASFSMILYGPPGTSKTTIAHKLAQDLGWPLYIVNQSAFLRRGVDNIDAEADRLFDLISLLQRVVVLFDEVEELVQERSSSDKLSRLLTTSMLPRINHLRSLHRVVFIFATNYVEAIDNAASRLGRFDIIHCVMPPTENERDAILRHLIEKYVVEDHIVKLFEKVRLVKSTEGFGFMDLEALVRQVLVIERLDKEVVTERTIDDARKNGMKPVERGKARMEKFAESKAKFDRP